MGKKYTKNTDAKKWIQYAKEDLTLAEKLYEEKAFIPHIIFNAHQCAEKYLKGLVSLQKGNFPYVHDLETLSHCASVQENDEIGLLNSCLILNYLYPFARYPGKEVLTRKLAQDALSSAKKIEKIILKYME